MKLTGRESFQHFNKSRSGGKTFECFTQLKSTEKKKRKKISKWIKSIRLIVAHYRCDCESVLYGWKVKLYLTMKNALKDFCVLIYNGLVNNSMNLK